MDVELLRKEYSRRGFVQLGNLLSSSLVDDFKADLTSRIEQAYTSRQPVAAFDKANGSHDRNPIFLDSGSSATVLHEPIAFDWHSLPDFGQYAECVARIGHGLHVVHGPVQEWLPSSPLGTYSRASGRIRPAVVETMYVRKSRWADPLPPHLDHTYLWTDPPSVQVVWIALDHADQSNGALLVDLAGPHRQSPRRLVRHGDEATLRDVDGVPADRLDHTRLRDLTLIPCNSGDGIMIDGLVAHGSGTSMSGASRDALAVHIVDLECEWAETNYLGNMVPLEL